MASLNDIETKVQSIINILYSRIVKTITGTLPLTFTAKAGNADDWSISGNDDNGTENLVNVNDFTVATNDSRTIISKTLAAGTYTFAVYQSTTLTSADRNTLVCFKSSGNEVENASVNYHLSAGWHYLTFTLAENEDIIIRYWSVNLSSECSLSNIMLVKGSTAPDHYIPYQQGVGEQRVDGYYVPLTISQTGQTDKTVDIYIGDAPLTAGQSISKTSTGVDLELFEGENTASTTLYNKPEMTIKYKYNGGN